MIAGKEDSLNRYKSEEQAMKSVASAVLIQIIRDWKKKKINHSANTVSFPYRAGIAQTIQSPIFEYWLEVSGAGLTKTEFIKYLTKL